MLSVEFQRLHGMGESLHQALRGQGYSVRIYAPVGPHADLLAYLVRRLLENGANSSFVNQLVNPEVPAQSMAKDPREAALSADSPLNCPRTCSVLPATMHRVGIGPIQMQRPS